MILQNIMVLLMFYHHVNLLFVAECINLYLQKTIEMLKERGSSNMCVKHFGCDVMRKVHSFGIHLNQTIHAIHLVT